MLPPEHYTRRRSRFLERLPNPTLLFAGGLRARNYPDNHYPPRPDSNFLLFFADPEPGSAAFFDPGDGSVTLFLPERTIDDTLWTGEVPTFEEIRERAGVDRVLPVEELEEHVQRMRGERELWSVAVADSRTVERARKITGDALDHYDPAKIGPPGLIDILADLRLRKTGPEIAEIRRAAGITRDAFASVLADTRPGVREQELCGTLVGCFARGGCVPAYPVILSVRGEILHNHAHGNTLREGDLVLADAGAELPSGYGADVTRTWPAGGSFRPEQRDVYEIVLRAQEEAIARVAPGVRWRDIHSRAAEVLAEGLVDLGLLAGSPSDLVARGAHAVFFPHGVGHLLGLDTHDLRSFGDRILYAPGRVRSCDFGTSSLRMDRDLEPGMVVTVEPGLYFVPAILGLDTMREQYREAVRFDRAESFLSGNGGRGFGGVRIEDDVLVTESGGEVLSPGIPKEIADLEAAIGRGASRAPGSPCA